MVQISSPTWTKSISGSWLPVEYLYSLAFIYSVHSPLRPHRCPKLNCSQVLFFFTCFFVPLCLLLPSAVHSPELPFIHIPSSQICLSHTGAAFFCSPSLIFFKPHPKLKICFIYLFFWTPSLAWHWEEIWWALQTQPGSCE